MVVYTLETAQNLARPRGWGSRVGYCERQELQFLTVPPGGRAAESPEELTHHILSPSGSAGVAQPQPRRLQVPRCDQGGLWWRWDAWLHFEAHSLVDAAS